MAGFRRRVADRRVTARHVLVAAAGSVAALTFASTGVGASTFTLHAKRSVAFTSTGTGTSAFTLNRLRPLTFTSTGVGSSAASLTAKRALSFSSTGTGTSAFALKAKRALAFTSTGVGASSFALSAKRSLSFSSTGSGTSAFSLHAKRALAFTSTGVGTSSFALTRVKPLAFSSTGVGTSAFSMRAQRALAFASTGSATSSFTLNATRALAFASTSTGTTSFTLLGKRAFVLASTGVGTSTFTFAPKGTIRFASTGTGTSAFTFRVLPALAFTSTGVGTSSFTTLNAKRTLPFDERVSPITSVVDNFNAGASQNLTSRTGWGATVLYSGEPTLVTDTVPTYASGGSGWHSNWRTGVVTDCESWLTLGNSSVGEIVELYARATNLPTPHAYYLAWQPWNGAYNLWVMVAGANGPLLASGTQILSAGDSIKLRCLGTEISVWFKSSAGAWTMLASVTDATYASGVVGLDTLGAPQVDEFGGGVLPASGAGIGTTSFTLTTVSRARQIAFSSTGSGATTFAFRASGRLTFTSTGVGLSFFYATQPVVALPSSPTLEAGMAGGGGYGAVMSDAFFRRYEPRVRGSRYEPRYKPTLRRQKSKV